MCWMSRRGGGVGGWKILTIIWLVIFALNMRQLLLWGKNPSAPPGGLVPRQKGKREECGT